MNSAFWRYTAFQIPGWIVAVGAGWWVQRTFAVPVWVAAGVPLAWIVKDYLLYPMLRFAYEVDHRLPIERLVGHRGVTTVDLAPEGYVRVRGELWWARAVSSSIDRGGAITVVAVEDSRLVVALTESHVHASTAIE